MLPKLNRLKKREDINRIFKIGSTFKENLLILKIIRNDLDKSRFSFIVSKKISKKAAVRNKIKRRLSEVVRSKLPKLKKGVDAILIVMPGLGTKEFGEIEGSVNRLFLKAKLL